MVSDYDDGVVLGKIVERGVGHVQVVVTAVAYFGEVWVVVGDDGALFAEQLNDGERGRFAQVVDIALIGDAEDEDFGSIHRLAVVVEAGGDLTEHEIGHGGVDFAGQLDEAGAEIEFPSFPGEIEGIDGYAVTAEAGAGVEGLEAEGLGFGSVDDFVDVNAHAHAELLELIDQGDVDAAIDVF